MLKEFKGKLKSEIDEALHKDFNVKIAEFNSQIFVLLGKKVIVVDFGDGSYGVTIKLSKISSRQSKFSNIDDVSRFLFVEFMDVAKETGKTPDELIDSVEAF